MVDQDVIRAQKRGQRRKRVDGENKEELKYKMKKQVALRRGGNRRREIMRSDFINHSNQYSESSVVRHLFAVWFGSRCRNFYFNRSPRMGAQSECIIYSRIIEALIDILVDF